MLGVPQPLRLGPSCLCSTSAHITTSLPKSNAEGSAEGRGPAAASRGKPPTPTSFVLSHDHAPQLPSSWRGRISSSRIAYSVSVPRLATSLVREQNLGWGKKETLPPLQNTHQCLACWAQQKVNVWCPLTAWQA